MSKPKKKKQKIIPFNSAITALKIHPNSFNQLLDKFNFSIFYNENGDKCLSDNDFKRLCHSDEVKNKSIEDFFHRTMILEEDERTGRNNSFNDHIKNKVDEYRDYIEILEKIHSNYIHKIDILRDESALCAAYIIYSKIINLLNLLCDSLENGYFHSNVLFRPIDELIDVALYFIVTENTDRGERHLKEWFREDKSPEPRICRLENARYLNSIVEERTTSSQKELTDNLYHLKSKWVHPSLSEIADIFPLKILKGNLEQKAFDYRKCSFPRKILEMTEFFQSSIWTAFQSFYFCFHEKLPLSQDEKDILYKQNKIFLDARNKRIVL
jgi:hypothetical protein